MSVSPSLLVLSTKIIGMRAMIKLNDMWVVRENAVLATNLQSKIALYCINGVNSLEVFAGPPVDPDTGEANGSFADDASLSLSIFETPVGVDEKTIIFEMPEWKPSPGSEAAEMQQIGRHDLVLSGQSEKTWQMAETLDEVTPGMVENIAANLRALETALAEKNIDSVLELQRPALENSTRALGTPLEAALASYAQFLGSMMDEKWQVDPFDAASLVYDLTAQGRIVRPIRADGGPVIRTSSGEEIFFVDPYYSRVGGRWVMVR